MSHSAGRNHIAFCGGIGEIIAREAEGECILRYLPMLPLLDRLLGNPTAETQRGTGNKERRCMHVIGYTNGYND